MTQDEKDDDKNFLSRWSQRKHEAKQPDSETPLDEAAEILPASPKPVAENTAEEKFDLSTLPKLEDVVEGTDITGFLKKGVPESVRNAALRKSWALDPAIRNYVNPALDYAYDWNTPGGVPGSSELATGMDVAKMVLQIMGSTESASAAASPDASDPLHRIDASVPGPDSDAAQNLVADLPTDAVRSSDGMITASPISDVSGQVGRQAVENVEERKTSDVGASQQAVRRHGTAKPRV
jgi:hypothetical protein